MTWHPTRPADWLSVIEALDIILENTKPAPSELVALDDALGRTLAQDVLSPIDHPPWDNSAMDGYAVRAADVRDATLAAPKPLKLIEKVPAGAFAAMKVTSGTAIRLMTGAPIPEGADSVIRVEHTQEQSGDVVLILNDADASRNIRPRGEDVRVGDVAVVRGTAVRAAEIGLLATVGAATVEVRRKPRVAILSTGNELAELDHFEEVRAGRKIINSNSHALAAAVRSAGGEPIVLGIARDDRASLHEKLMLARDAELLVTSAGASVGEHDLVKDVLEELGTRTAFWRVRVRPGSPFSFGMMGETMVFGLPGNPVSALVTCELFVKPAIRRALGRSALYSATVRAEAAEHISAKGALTHFLRARLARTPHGTWLATLTGAQGSGMISSMARADGLLVVPEAVQEIEPGTAVDVIRLHTSDETQTELGFTI